MNTPTADAILDSLTSLNPIHLFLDNESHMHAGYYEGKESHFKLVIVSDTFNDKRPVARHQLIYTRINSLMVVNGGTIHALAIHAYTPQEWAGQAPNSPHCAGQNHASF